MEFGKEGFEEVGDVAIWWGFVVKGKVRRGIHFRSRVGVVQRRVEGVRLEVACCVATRVEDWK